MNWNILAPIIAQYGLDAAIFILGKVTSGAVATQDDFDELRSLTNRNANVIMKTNLIAAGIPLDDPKAIALLKLTDVP